MFWWHLLELKPKTKIQISHYIKCTWNVTASTYTLFTMIAYVEFRNLYEMLGISNDDVSNRAHSLIYHPIRNQHQRFTYCIMNMMRQETAQAYNFLEFYSLRWKFWFFVRLHSSSSFFSTSFAATRCHRIENIYRFEIINYVRARFSLLIYSANILLTTANDEVSSLSMSQIHTLNAHFSSGEYERTVNENFFETVCLSNDQNWRERQKKNTTNDVQWLGAGKGGKGREAQIKRRTLHLMNYVFKSICELIRPHTPFKLCKNVIFWKRFEGNCSMYTHSSLVLFSRLRAPSWTWTWALPFLFFRVVANKSSVRASTIWAMLSLQCSY